MTYPTDEMVEAAAEALHNLERPPADWGDTWNELADSARKPWLDKARAVLTAAGPVLDREVVRLAVLDAMGIAEFCGEGRCSEDDWHSEYNRAIDAILASAMTREQVEREVIERLAKVAEQSPAELIAASAHRCEKIAAWLRSLR